MHILWEKLVNGLLQEASSVVVYYFVTTTTTTTATIIIIMLSLYVKEVKVTCCKDMQQGTVLCFAESFYQ